MPTPFHFGQLILAYSYYGSLKDLEKHLKGPVHYLTGLCEDTPKIRKNTTSQQKREKMCQWLKKISQKFEKIS
jgi:hypothetical protein